METQGQAADPPLRSVMWGGRFVALVAAIFLVASLFGVYLAVRAPVLQLTTVSPGHYLITGGNSRTRVQAAIRKCPRAVVHVRADLLTLSCPR